MGIWLQIKVDGIFWGKDKIRTKRGEEKQPIMYHCQMTKAKSYSS